MKVLLSALLATPAVLALAVAGSSSHAQGTGGTLYLRSVMKEDVAPAIATIWDIGNAAMDDNGGLDASKLDGGSWPALAEAASRLETASRSIAGARTIKAAAPDDMETSEFEVSMASVQEALEKDPDGIRRFAFAFAEHAAALKAAADARDAVKTGELVGLMDAECAACHAQYWYAE